MNLNEEPHILPKQKGKHQVQFIGNFRNINSQLKHKSNLIPEIGEMLLKLEGFKYATSLILNMV